MSDLFYSFGCQTVSLNLLPFKDWALWSLVIICVTQIEGVTKGSDKENDEHVCVGQTVKFWITFQEAYTLYAMGNIENCLSISNHMTRYVFLKKKSNSSA